MGKRTKKAAKAAKKKKKTIIAIVDGTLVFLVIILPLLAVILYAFGVPIPRLAMGIYTSVAFLTAGVLFIVFTRKGKFDYGKEGYYINRFSGFKWLHKKEAKEANYVMGGFLVATGVLLAVLTVCYCM